MKLNETVNWIYQSIIKYFITISGSECFVLQLCSETRVHQRYKNKRTREWKVSLMSGRLSPSTVKNVLTIIVPTQTIAALSSELFSCNKIFNKRQIFGSFRRTRCSLCKPMLFFSEVLTTFFRWHFYCQYVTFSRHC